MSKTNILILGATGYIGGSVLSLFLKREDFKSFHITSLVRSPEKAEKLQDLGINAVVGSHSDLPLVEKLAKENEFVFSMADADNMDAIEAILRGLKLQFEKTGRKPVLIHTSGTGVVASPGDGYYDENAAVYDDTNASQMGSIPHTQIHRPVDMDVVAADEAGYVKSYVVMPGAIIGMAKTMLTEIGVQNPFSVVVVALVRVSLALGKAIIIGDGSNVWPYVSIGDASNFYMKLYNSIVNKSDIGHGTEGYYFVENGESTLSSIAKVIGKAMVDLGKTEAESLVPLSEDEMNKYFGSKMLGSNCRCKGNRSRSLGWSPKDRIDDVLAGIKEEVNIHANRG